MENKIKGDQLLYGYLSVYSDGSCFYSLSNGRSNPDEVEEPVQKIHLNGVRADKLVEIGAAYANHN